MMEVIRSIGSARVTWAVELEMLRDWCSAFVTCFLICHIDDIKERLRTENREPPHNVLGGDLDCCCADVRGTGIGTGFYRDGFCSTGDDDRGRHCVCIEATADFLRFSAAVGNDLSTPFPQYVPRHVNPGPRMCLQAPPSP